MGLFASLNSEDAFENEHKLDTLYQGSLFKSIEYEISNIVSKIDNIDQFDANQIKDIIIRQHNMILNYDLFLVNNDNRQKAYMLQIKDLLNKPRRKKNITVGGLNRYIDYTIKKLTKEYQKYGR